MSNLIIFTGPSQSGKSTALNYFLTSSSKDFRAICLPKYTTRQPRNDDNPREVICCTDLPSDCDLVYQQYDQRYGLNSNDILDELKLNKTVLLVLNDVRTIYEVKRIFGSICYSIFVFRQAPNYDEFIRISKNRGSTDINQMEKRLKKAEAIYRIYIENIPVFDKVLLNSFGKRELKMQVNGIIKFICEQNNSFFKS